MIKITPNVTTKITVPAQQKVQYAYNHVSSVVKKNQVQADFRTDRIDISAPSEKQANAVMEKLKELGINFIK